MQGVLSEFGGETVLRAMRPSPLVVQTFGLRGPGRGRQGGFARGAVVVVWVRGGAVVLVLRCDSGDGHRHWGRRFANELRLLSYSSNFGRR